MIMKNRFLLIFTFIPLFVILSACASSNKNKEVESNSEEQLNEEYTAVLTDYIVSGDPIFVFYANLDDYEQILVVNDNGENDLEELRNPSNFGKTYKLVCGGNSISQEELTTYLADSIVSFEKIADNKEFSAKVKKTLYEEFSYEIIELELPFKIDYETLDIMADNVISIPDSNYRLFIKTEGKYKDIEKEYGMESYEMNKYRHETELGFLGKLVENEPDFDLYIISEIPFNRKLGAEGAPMTFRIVSIDKNGNVISSITFAREFSAADNYLVEGEIFEDLVISLNTKYFEDGGGDPYIEEPEFYHVTKNGKIEKDEL
jgi:hypothetical protein